MPVVVPVVVLVAGRKQSSSATFGVFTVHPSQVSPHKNFYYRSNCARCVPGYGDAMASRASRAMSTIFRNLRTSLAPRGSAIMAACG
jgi:hypothetical protein